MKQIAAEFRVEGTVIHTAPHGSGHINGTWLVVTNRGRLYVLQRINRHVFRDVAGMMANVTAVCGYLAERAQDERGALHLVPTRDGETWLEREDGCYRMFDYVLGGVCLDRAESAEDMYQSGMAFGAFQRQLAEFPADTLHVTIPRFHDTPDRFRLLHEAIERNSANRRQLVQREIDALLQREHRADALHALYRAGEIPLRVTHNDTKLNNVMLDDESRQPLCVMDLDTVMPGFAAHDFGDAIRFGASTAAEDEQDLSLVKLDMAMYEAFTRGYLAGCGDALWPREIETLPMGAYLMTLECAARFLTDYLNGDIYFHIDREHHNLDRCRTQLKLVSEMEAQGICP